MFAHHVGKCLLAVAMIAASASLARAALVVYTDPNVGGFVPNSSVNTPAFNAAIGVPDEFLSFSFDKFGNPTPSGSINGSLLSNNVVFSSGASMLGFGGGASALVNISGSGPASEIGPFGSWDGTLTIDFLAAGNYASIVGFGPVEFGTIEQIRVFDQNGALAGVFGGVSNNVFTFFGVQGTGGTLISRIEMDGNFFAIQDIQFDFQQTPEPASLLAWGLLTGVGLVGYRLRRRKVTA
jgi:hypothetical protein